MKHRLRPEGWTALLLDTGAELARRHFELGVDPDPTCVGDHQHIVDGYNREWVRMIRRSYDARNPGD